MMDRKKRRLIALLCVCGIAGLTAGCDKLKTDSETEKVTTPVTEKQTVKETEPETELLTEIVTEKPTEVVTEPETVPETEPETETETEVFIPQDLTMEEELAQEIQLDQLKTMYAMDDVNVRTNPSTDSDILDSYDQGEKVIVSGETPNWAVVELQDYDVTGDFDATGYVSKRFLSESEVPEKTSEEREEAIMQELGEIQEKIDSGELLPEDTAVGGTVQNVSVNQDTAQIDADYEVQAYAESFSVYAMTGANLRATPSQEGEIIQTIASGSSLKALGYTERWYKVQVDGVVGYVNRNLFSTEPVE